MVTSTNGLESMLEVIDILPNLLLLQFFKELTKIHRHRGLDKALNEMLWFRKASNRTSGLLQQATPARGPQGPTRKS